eukprot:7345991-Pyramimonas_sp.AAC.1
MGRQWAIIKELIRRFPNYASRTSSTGRCPISSLRIMASSAGRRCQSPRQAKAAAGRTQKALGGRSQVSHAELVRGGAAEGRVT